MRPSFRSDTYAGRLPDRELGMAHCAHGCRSFVAGAEVRQSSSCPRSTQSRFHGIWCACAARQRHAAERWLSAGADLNWELEGFWLLIVRFDRGAAGATSPKISPSLPTPISLPFLSAMVSGPAISSCPGN